MISRSFAQEVSEDRQAYDQALKLTTDSTLSQEFKDNAARFHHFNLARVAIAKKDLATAKTETEAVVLLFQSDPAR